MYGKSQNMLSMLLVSALSSLSGPPPRITEKSAKTPDPAALTKNQAKARRRAQRARKGGH